MEPNGGLLVAAIVILAIASGCRRDDRPSDAARGGMPHRSAGGDRAKVTAVQTPEDSPAKAEATPPVNVVSKTPAKVAPKTPVKVAPKVPVNVVSKMPATAPADPPTAGRARSGLDELAANAKSLRHALLHADFRGVDEATTQPTEKAKEGDHDPR